MPARHSATLLWAMASALSLAIGVGQAHAADRCMAGPWRVVSGTPDEQGVQYQTRHFAFRWKPGTVAKADAVSAGAILEEDFAFDLNVTHFPEPFCDTADKHKANVNLDPSFGLTGGPTGDRDMGMWIGPPALKDRWGLAHELTHALQGSTRGMQDSPFTGWMWESHANWMTHQLPMFRDNPHCSEMLVNSPHLYLGSTRDRYCNWQIFEYLKDRFGYDAVNGIWRHARKPGEPGHDEEDPFKVLMRDQKWSLGQMNTVMGEWALHNVHWDYTDPDGRDQGQVYRRSYGANEAQDGQRFARLTRLDRVEANVYAVPSYQAPQRWGYNLVRLMPDKGARELRVTFHGVVQDKPATTTLPALSDEPSAVPQPASDWRWGVVAVDGSGHARISAVMAGAKGALAVPLKPDDTALYLVVMGTPSTFEPIRWEQPYGSIYRYPWMARFEGALPAGAESISSGHRHPNGGGWVAPGAVVEAGAYVGPDARVLGGRVLDHARIEDHAIVRGGEVSGQAVVGALSLITDGVTVKDDAVVRTTFLGLGQFERGAVIGGTAKLYGDVELRDAPHLTHGAYTGFVDAAAREDVKRGAALDAIPPEVTAVPRYVWAP